MIRLLAFFIIFTTLIGCTAGSEDESASISSPLANVQTPPFEELPDDGRISFSIEDVNVSLRVPEQWAFYETAYGLVMTEEISTIAANGELDGLLTHVFVPPLENLPIPISDTNRALGILRGIIANPDYVGLAQFSQPQSFMWGDYEAAYVLMNNGEAVRTLVLAVVIPGTRGLIACNISAPTEEADRIRTELPHLLDGLEINGVSLHGAALNQLPEVLPFPEM